MDNTNAVLFVSHPPFIHIVELMHDRIIPFSNWPRIETILVPGGHLQHVLDHMGDTVLGFGTAWTINVSALRVVEEVLAEPVVNGANWTLPRLQREGTDRGLHLEIALERGAAQKRGFRRRRPRHSLRAARTPRRLIERGCV